MLDIKQALQKFMSKAQIKNAIDCLYDFRCFFLAPTGAQGDVMSCVHASVLVLHYSKNSGDLKLALQDFRGLFYQMDHIW